MPAHDARKGISPREYEARRDEVRYLKRQPRPEPPDHPLKGSEVLRDRGYSDETRLAILGHANYTGVARDSLLARALYASDELTGFVVACALVRPNGIWDLESKSVKKKLKDKAFARTVNRDEVYEGATELNVDLGEHIDFIIAALRNKAEDVGLKPINTPQ